MNALMTALLWTALIAGGFLAGSVYFAKLITAWRTGKDVCEAGEDGNPGAANAFHACGRTWGFVCFLLDFLKGFVPVLIATLVLDASAWEYALVVIAPVLGHAAGIFNRGHGGKCISVSFGVLAGALPVSPVVLPLIVCYLVFSLLLKIRSHTARTIVSFALAGAAGAVIALCMHLTALAVACAVVSVIVIFKHCTAPKLSERVS